LQGRMSAAGYDPRRRTLFIWEGVTNYLTEDAVDGTLRWCAGAAAGSTVVFTYVHRQVFDAPQAFYGTEKLFMTLSAAGERWTFGLDLSQLSSFLAQRGFANCSPFTSALRREAGNLRCRDAPLQRS